MAGAALHRTLRALCALAVLALGCATRSDPAALSERAHADFAAGDTEEAIAQMREVVALAPDVAQVHFSLGLMLLRTDRVDEAEPELARAVALAPRDARKLAAHGLALRAQQKWSAAESALLRALLLEPNDTSTIAALGEVYRLSGDYEKCAARYEQVVWQLELREPSTLGESELRALGEAREHARVCAMLARAAKRS